MTEINIKTAALAVVAEHLNPEQSCYCVRWETKFAFGQVEYWDGQLILKVNRFGNTKEDWRTEWKSCEFGEVSDDDLAQFAEKNLNVARCEVPMEWAALDDVAVYDVANPNCFDQLAAKLAEYGVDWQN